MLALLSIVVVARHRNKELAVVLFALGVSFVQSLVTFIVIVAANIVCRGLDFVCEHVGIICIDNCAEWQVRIFIEHDDVCSHDHQCSSLSLLPT